MKTFKKHRKLYILLICICMLLVFLIYGLSQSLETTFITVTSKKIPNSFDNFRIVQISDLHCKAFGNQESDLIEAVKACHPDIIVLTGDMIDEAHLNLDHVTDLLSGISKLAPIYSVNGNHEFDYLELYDTLCSIYKKYGVIQIDNSTIQISKGNDFINLTGVNTQVFGNHQSKPDIVSAVVEQDQYHILLHHYSNYFDSLSTLGYDLILAGHTHGGVVRLPLIGGLLSNEGDLLPKYDGGTYQNGNCIMVSSRGLGEASWPRFLNRPELICITLKTE